MARYVEACEYCKWHFRIWKKSDPSTKTLVPFRCRSWRHSGECRLWKGAQDFMRCKEAMESLENWCHITLTYSDQSHKSITQTYKTGVFLWSMLRKRLVYDYGDIKYIQTWERHASGFPHLHVALSNAALFQEIRHMSRFKGDKQFGVWNFQEHLQRHATECFFGERGWLEKIHTRAGFANYLNKLARELTGGKKEYQIPENAPPHFRRLRASRGLLPPKVKDPDVTGILVHSEMPEDGPAKTEGPGHG